MLRWFAGLPLLLLGLMSLGWFLLFGLLTAKEGADAATGRSLLVHVAFGAAAVAGSIGLFGRRTWGPAVSSVAALAKLVYVLVRADDVTSSGADHVGAGLLIAGWSLLEALILAGVLLAVGVVWIQARAGK